MPFIYFKLLFSDKNNIHSAALSELPLNCGLLLSLSSSPPPPLSSCQNNPPSPPQQQQQHYYLLYCSTETCTIGWEKRKRERERDRERERMNREQFELSMVVCSIIKTKSTSTQFPFCLLEQ
jgi:hypothetical protein